MFKNSPSTTAWYVQHLLLAVQQAYARKPENSYLYSKTRDFDHSFCSTLVPYRTRTVWDVFQRLHDVTDKDLSSKPLY